jgi:hypothetical protein
VEDLIGKRPYGEKKIFAEDIPAPAAEAPAIADAEPTTENPEATKTAE